MMKLALSLLLTLGAASAVAGTSFELKIEGQNNRPLPTTASSSSRPALGAVAAPLAESAACRAVKAEGCAL